MRAWKQNSAGRTYFIYDGTVPILELDSTGTIIATNTFGSAGLISRRTNSQSSYYSFNEQGAVSEKMDSNGNLLSNHLFDSHGASLSTINTEPFGYGAQFGYYTDTESGLQLLTYRYYDPQDGRFLTRDPIAYAGGINLYAYSNNDPVNGIDPSGLERLNHVLRAPSLPTPDMTLLGVLAHVSAGFGDGICEMFTFAPFFPDGNPLGWLRGYTPGGAAVGSNTGEYMAGSAGAMLWAVAMGGAGGLETGASGTLTALEEESLQGIANEFDTTIDVVGSRGAGAGRNIETDLPFGKGTGTRSDIDIRIDGQVDINTRGALSDTIYNRVPGAEVRTRIGETSRPPFIQISPKP